MRLNLRIALQLWLIIALSLTPLLSQRAQASQPAAPTAAALTVTKANAGGGTVTSSPSGIDCGATCTAEFALSTVVTLTASPQLGSTFAGWTGACVGFLTCVVTISEARAVTATFLLNPISSGGAHNCRLISTGDAQCWAWNGYGQSPGTVTGPFAQIAAGLYHTCALKTDGSASCWGAGTSGTDSPHNGQSVPPTPNGPFGQISAGQYHTCAVKTDGTPVCWGNNSNDRSTPVGGPYVQISAGMDHTCALEADGDVACWGNNSSGQAPTSVTGPFSYVSASVSFTCAIRTSGDLQCWGYSTAGEAPTSLSGPFLQVATGDNHTCVLKGDATIQCYGTNTDGQAPSNISGTFDSLSAGLNYVCAVHQDMLVKCWGYNGGGQAPPVSIQPSSLPEGLLNIPYTQTLTLSDFSAPYTVTLTGALPTGITMDSSGKISGTPTLAGTYPITVQVADWRGLYVRNSYTLTILDHARPTANAGADQIVLPGGSIQLDGSASSAVAGYTVASYQWQQTAGSTGTLINATSAQPTFTAPNAAGVMTLLLVVTDSGGVSSLADTVNVTAQNVTISSSSPVQLGETTYFTATSLAQNVSYSWDFGDGATSSGAEVQHAYATLGRYTSIVTATAGGGTSIVTTTMTVIDEAPGGIFSGLSLWLKADAGITTPVSGTAVATWVDQAAGRDVAQAHGSHQPSYRSAAWNGNPVLSFDTTDYLTRTSVGSDLFGPADATILFVKQSDSSSGVWFKWETSNSNRVGFEVSSNRARFDMPRDNSGSGRLVGSTSVRDRPHLVAGWRSTTTQRIYLDGTQDGSATHNNTLNTSSSSTLGIGKQPDGSLNWTGTLGEVIVYKRALSDAERNQIESYLALKYGLPLGSTTSPISYTASAGSTIWSGSATYQNNVAGIGRDDMSALDQRRSTSAVSGDILTVAHGSLAAPTALPADRSFLIWGHDGGSATSGVTGTHTIGAHTRLSRTWRVQRTGVLDGTVFTFDLSALAAGSYDPTALALLVDTDTDFSDAQLVVGAVNGTTVSFSVSELPALGYVALLTDGPPSLVVSVSGQGSVTSDPAGISCGVACVTIVAQGTPITLTATPEDGWRFTGWGGACAGAVTTCALSLDESRSVTAHFCAEAPGVSTAADEGSGSLRDAITYACEDSTISFSADATIRLSSTLEITQGLTIDGAGYEVIISGDSDGDDDGDVRPFNISGGAPVTLSGLTIADGVVTGREHGGAVLSSSPLTIIGSTIRDSAATDDGGGVYSSAGLTVIDSTITGNQTTYQGGGVASANGLTIINSTLANNQAALCGGAASGGTATVIISNTTFAENHATYVGGGLYSFSSDGTIINSTFSGNRADGVGEGVSASAARLNSSGPGGAIAVERANMTIKNSILANSAAASECDGANGAVINLSDTLAEDGSCGAPLTGDPKLSALGSHGGGAATAATQTFALLPGSPALDAGSDCPSADQRGVTRPQGGGCDLGAYESRGFTLSAISGGGQIAAAGGAFPNPLVVQLSAVDSGVQIGAGHVITITAPASGASLSTTTLTATTDLSGTASLSIVANSIEGSYTVVAAAPSVSTSVSFTLQQFEGRLLTVTLAGDGTGSVTSSPAGIACGITCTAVLSYGSAITLTATPDQDVTFTGWSGACSGISSTCTVTLDQARSVTATFERDVMPLFLPLIRR